MIPYGNALECISEHTNLPIQEKHVQQEDFKRLLEAKREELNNRLADIRHTFTHGRSAEYSELAIETENDDVLKGLEFEANQEIQKINQALHRIKEDEFGYCECCGEAISEERLKILPFTQYCRHCAK